MGNSILYKVAVGLGALGVFLLIWINLAVGIIGSALLFRLAGTASYRI